MVDDTEQAPRHRTPLRVMSGGRPRVLAVGSDVETLPMLRRLALERGMRWLACDSLANLEVPRFLDVADRRPDLIFVFDPTALEQVRSLRRERQEVVLVLDPDRRVDREASRHADITVLCRPLDPRFVARLLDEVGEECRRAAGSLGGRADHVVPLAGFGGLQGGSAAMRRVFSHMQRMAASSGSVLIYGERGTGKARAARALHQASRCAAGPFLVIECRDGLALRPEPPASTMPARRSVLPECLEAARGGTLFLDHLNELSPQVQIPLLRALESLPFNRSPGPGSVRVIAAIDRDPLAAMRAGRLRQDLYDRLAQFVLRLPPLRERGHDVVDLARWFLRECNERCGTATGLSAEALELMCRHAWPGNLGELKNVVEHAHARAGPIITPDDLPSAVGGGYAFADREAGELRNIV